MAGTTTPPALSVWLDRQGATPPDAAAEDGQKRGYVLYPSTVSRDNIAWWHEAGLRHGLRIEIGFYQRDVPIVLPEGGPDFAVVRGFNAQLSAAYENLGVKVINSAASATMANDKLAAALHFERTGVTTPTSLHGQTSYEEVRSLLGATFVVKNRVGLGGRQVHLVSSEQEFTEAVNKNPLPMFQEYVSHSHGRDIRVWVMDGEPISHVLRYSTDDFRSNYTLGGSFRRIELPDEAARLAVAAAQFAGLTFAGVDLLFTPDGGFTVCEVNSSPQFRTAPTDVPDAVCRIIANRWA